MILKINKTLESQLGKLTVGWILGSATFPGLYAFLIVKYAVPVIPVSVLLASAYVLLTLIALMLRHAAIDKALICPGVLIWAGLMAYFLFSLSWSSNRECGLFKWQLALLFGFCPGLCFIVMRRHLSSVYLFGILLAMWLCFIVLLNICGETADQIEGDRLALPGGNAIWCARATLVAIPIILFEARFPIWMRSIAVAVGFMTAWRCQSRGPLVACIITVLLCNIIYGRNKIRGVLWHCVILGCVCACIWGTIYLCNSLQVIYNSRLGEKLSMGSYSDDRNTTYRIESQQTALRLFAENPLFGVGLGGFLHSQADLIRVGSGSIEREYPHNLPLEVASETGAIGLVIWCIAICYSLLSARCDQTVFALILLALLNCLFSGDFAYNSELILFALLGIARHEIIFNTTSLSSLTC